MALTDDVREHERRITTLVERLDRAATDLAAGALSLREAIERVHQLQGRVLVLEDRVNDLRDDRNERDRRLSTTRLAIAGWVLTLILFVVQMIRRR